MKLHVLLYFNVSPIITHILFILKDIPSFPSTPTFCFFPIFVQRTLNSIYIINVLLYFNVSSTITHIFFILKASPPPLAFSLPYVGAYDPETP